MDKAFRQYHTRSTFAECLVAAAREASTSTNPPHEADDIVSVFEALPYSRLEFKKGD